MYLSNTYLEEGFPFHGRKQKQMEAFLKKSGLTPGLLLFLLRSLNRPKRVYFRLWFTL